MTPGIASSKAQKVYLVLKDRISRGAYPQGAPLPGEQAIALEHGISRITIRRALAELEREGLVSRRQGVGTFATPHYAAKPVISDFADLLANRAEMGRRTTVRVDALEYVRAHAEVAKALHLQAGLLVQRSVRIRFIDHQPFSYLTTFVPEPIGRSYDAAELGTQPLLALLERSGAVPDSATQTITASLATPEIARALDLNVGSALIGIIRTVFDEDGSGIEHLEAFYRPDRYSFQMRLQRNRRQDGRTWAPANVEGDEHDKMAKSSP